MLIAGIYFNPTRHILSSGNNDTILVLVLLVCHIFLVTHCVVLTGCLGASTSHISVLTSLQIVV